jgi:hypothetical protein
MADQINTFKFTKQDIELFAKCAAPAGFALIGNIRRDGLFKIGGDAKDIEACKAAALQLYAVISHFHGIPSANKVMTQFLQSKKNMAAMKNYRLLRASEGKSAEQAAVELAEVNKNLPRNQRFGPTGTTSPSTLAKQIRRLRNKHAAS